MLPYQKEQRTTVIASSSIFTVEPIKTYHVTHSSCSFVMLSFLLILMERKLYEVGSRFHRDSCSIGSGEHKEQVFNEIQFNFRIGFLFIGEVFPFVTYLDSFTFCVYTLG